MEQGFWETSSTYLYYESKPEATAAFADHKAYNSALDCRSSKGPLCPLIGIIELGQEP